MEKMFLVLIGILALAYVGRIVWKEMKGESQCHCSGGCGGGCHKQDN
ncbi:hypothetical protein [Sporomusa aerivorans]